MIYFDENGKKEISNFSLYFLNLEKSNYIVIAFGRGFQNAIFYIENSKKRINRFFLISPLGFESSAKELNLLMQKGIDIEVYIGDRNANIYKIVDFFRIYGIVYIIRNRDYILDFKVN